MESDITKRQKLDHELEVMGISRSGRVRKKSSKLMDFESPDDIDSRQRKTINVREALLSQKNTSHDGISPYFDSKSDNEEEEPVSTDSDYYDPSMDHQDSMDSMDSEDIILSDNENSLNSSNENIGSQSRNFMMDKDLKKKNSKNDIMYRDNSSYGHSNFNINSSGQRISSRNRITVSRSLTNYNPVNQSLHSVNNTNGGIYRVVGIGPLEISAHLRLLGESLAVIGERLKEHEGQIAISGSVSVLLDTLLCSLAPLICLTAHIPSIAPPLQVLQDTLDNIAYIMPGL